MGHVADVGEMWNSY